jgi:large subunit ribosomal protein L24
MAKGTRRTKIKKGDTVIIMSGGKYADKYDPPGVRALRKVLAVDPVKGKVKVEGACIVTKHRKANRALNQEGGIDKAEGWLDISNVQLVDPVSNKPTRARYETGADGTKERVLLARQG